MVSTFSGQSVSQFTGFTFQSLDAGASIGINGPSGSRTLAKTSIPSLGSIYSAKLGDTTPGNYLDPGNYTITGPGGPGVGAFSVTLSIPAALVWTNQDGISTVNRSNGLPITWTGGDPAGFVDITGSSSTGLSLTTFVSASFTCRAKVSDGNFTVPPLVLLSLPPSGSISGFTIPGSLSVGATSTPKTFTATGLDYGVASASQFISKSVTYQ